MNIRDELLKEHSKVQIDRVVVFVGADKARFEGLMEAFFSHDKVLSQRAAWAMSNVALGHLPLFMPYLQRAFENLKRSDLHDAIVRNTLRVMQFVKIPGEMQAGWVDMALSYVENTASTPAIKAFSIGILHNICKEHPDLAKEVKWVLSGRMEFESPAFRSRAKVFMKSYLG